MIFRVIAILITSLGAILWFLKREESHRRPVEKSGRVVVDEKTDTNQTISASQIGDQEITGEELDESQAAEIVTTWNLLNPP